MKSDVDKLATSTVATPLQIWDEISARYYRTTEENTVVRGMARGQVIQRVHHARAMHYGTDVHGRVEVPPLVNCKNSNFLFLQFHHVWANTNNKLDRVIGWANPSLLNLLRYENITLFVDGTFRCVPDTFAQCVVIMVHDRGTKLYVPVFFVLCTAKTYDTYWNLLQFVSNACGEPIKPKEVVCDFEAALINAVSDWFPQAAVIGCLFHFKQACKRRMMKDRVHEDQVKVAMLPGFLDMLTVIEHDKIASLGIPWVKRAIQERCIKDNINYTGTKWATFWKYFERTWLKLFPPKFWNVHGYSNPIVARTNNPLERFNRELNAAFGTPHPSLPRFIQTVEDIARRRVLLRDDINLGRAKPPRRAERYKLPIPVNLLTIASGDGSTRRLRATNELLRIDGWPEYHCKLVKNMASAAKIAKLALERDQLRCERYYNQKVRNNEYFKVGDTAWLFKSPRGTGVTRLAHSGLVPVKLTADGGFDNWIVRKEDTGEGLVAHCSFMISYYRPKSQLAGVADQILEEMAKEEELFGDDGGQYWVNSTDAATEPATYNRQ
ncbi:hypothetical protein PHMEG_00020157 [Phytophthora megakarya]|uniref:MULE transposase domain-containing protein n=1 Tax=Phytophthora megakarya TaxID=4795 RepID=A0A225VQ40_9STRA|nr:hypothetical protein PHMEG_00020157 [Phytophthora megakarya]